MIGLIIYCGGLILVCIGLAYWHERKQDLPSLPAMNAEATNCHFESCQDACWSGFGWIWVYRVAVVAALIIDFSTKTFSGKTFYFFTEWNFLLIAFYFLLVTLIGVVDGLQRATGSCRCCVWCSRPSEGMKEAKAGCCGTIALLIFEIIMPCAYLVTLMFWAVLAKSYAKDHDLWTYGNLMAHMFNSVTLTVELLPLTNAMHLRAPHWILPMLWGGAYGIFTWCNVAWNPEWNGKPRYAFLDTDQGFISYLMYTALFVAIAVFYGICFGLHRCKHYFWPHYGGRRTTLTSYDSFRAPLMSEGDFEAMLLNTEPKAHRHSTGDPLLMQPMRLNEKPRSKSAVVAMPGVPTAGNL